MRGRDWGRLYDEYHARSYNPKLVETDVAALRADESVTAKKGIYEYVLTGATKPQLLQIRLFDKKISQQAFEQQAEEARTEGVSNCPHCALGSHTSKTHVYKFNEMEADHVAAWSKGGPTTMENCQMLCQPHNRAKENSWAVPTPTYW